METALYYGFSTIAQTLAAAIALLGALALFRLQAVVAAMRGPAAILTDRYHVDGEGHEELRRLLVAENFQSIEELFRTGRYKQAADINHEAINARETLTRLLASRSELLGALKLGLYWTAGVIAGSVATIFLVPMFAGVLWLVAIIATSGIGLLVYCLRVYFAIVKLVAG